MTDEMIINDKELREELIQRVDVLEKVKELLLIPKIEAMTLKQLANYYEVDPHTIEMVCSRNADELKSDGVCHKKVEDFLNSQYVRAEKSSYTTTFIYDNGVDIKMSNSGLKIFPRRAILRVGMLLRDSIIAKEIRTQLLNIEEKASDKTKTSSINEEENLLMNIAIAYKSGDINKLMSATSIYNQYQTRYIRELERKARMLDEMANNGSSVTTAISQKIKNTDKTQKWEREENGEQLGQRTLFVLSYVHDFINDNGFSPTVREIGKAVGLKSTSSVQAHIDKLDSLGFLVKDYKKTRNIRINEEKYIAVMN